MVGKLYKWKNIVHCDVSIGATCVYEKRSIVGRQNDEPRFCLPRATFFKAVIDQKCILNKGCLWQSKSWPNIVSRDQPTSNNQLNFISQSAIVNCTIISYGQIYC